MKDVLVYSTDHGRICPDCQEPMDRCRCKQKQREAIKGSGQVRVRRETASRNGKTVSTISGLAVSASELVGIAKKLKASCGAGGTVKDGVIEIQGDHVERLLSELEKLGVKAKRGGG